MDSYDQFVGAVAEGRKMDIATVKQIADGRVYSGRQALKLKLIDELGGYDEAIDSLQKICMDKSHAKEKLPVEDKATEGFLTSLLESTAGKFVPMSLTSESDIFNQILPESMKAQYFHQPLWMLQ